MAPADAPSSATPSSPLFDSIPSAIAAYAAGEFIIVLDNPARENEGDLIILASALTPRKASFLIHHSSGYLCAPMPASRADHLGLPPMVPEAASKDPHRTAYTLTVDADLPEISTGISARDRARTCNLLADPAATKASLRRPGHVVPLRAKDGGVRVRQGHTEAAVEFARLAGLREEERVGVIAEVVEADTDEEADAAANGVVRKAERGGADMARRDECLAFGKRYGIPVVTIEDLVKYLDETEPLEAGKAGKTGQ